MATTKVSALTNKATLTGSEEILINDGGTSKKSTVAAVTATNTTAIALNTAKTGITSGQASAITANTAKTGITSGQASAITANTAKTTNATHTGEVTGSGALTIADNIVDEANLKVSNAPTNGQFLSAQSGNTGGLTWAAASGGGGIGAFVGTSIAISSDDTALANDDGTDNGNIGLGVNALNAATTGSNNIALGKGAGDSITTGSNNVCHGFFSGQAIGNQTLNTLVGYATGYNQNSTGNTALGASALYGGGNGAVSAYNTALGAYSGMYISSGAYNCALGAEALKGNSTSKLTGSYNIGIGYQTGYSLSSGANNQLIGYQSGKVLTTGSYNVTSGYQSGLALTTGTNNIILGKEAGKFATTASHNIVLGEYAGYGIGSVASNNIAIGAYTLASNFSGGSSAKSNNIAIGRSAGYKLGQGNAGGENNVLIGRNAGRSSVSGNACVYLGYNAGYNETASNKLHIANNSTESLIEGDFSAKTLNINGALTVNGAAVGGGGGAMEFISTQALSGSLSQIQFTGLSGYKSYRIVMSVYISGSLAPQFRFRVGTGGTDITTDTYRTGGSLKAYSDITTNSAFAYTGFLDIFNLNEALPTTLKASGVADTSQVSAPSAAQDFVSSEIGSTARNSVTIYTNYSGRTYVSGSYLTLYGIKNS